MGPILDDNQTLCSSPVSPVSPSSPSKHGRSSLSPTSSSSSGYSRWDFDTRSSFSSDSTLVESSYSPSSKLTPNFSLGRQQTFTGLSMTSTVVGVGMHLGKVAKMVGSLALNLVEEPMVWSTLTSIQKVVSDVEEKRKVFSQPRKLARFLGEVMDLLRHSDSLTFTEHGYPRRIVSRTVPIFEATITPEFLLDGDIHLTKESTIILVNYYCAIFHATADSAVVNRLSFAIVLALIRYLDDPHNSEKMLTTIPADCLSSGFQCIHEAIVNNPTLNIFEIPSLLYSRSKLRLLLSFLELTGDFAWPLNSLQRLKAFMVRALYDEAFSSPTAQETSFTIDIASNGPKVGKLWFQSTPFTAETLVGTACLQLRTHSSHQGWVSYSTDPISYSWFEIAVIPKQSSPPGSLPVRDELGSDDTSPSYLSIKTTAEGRALSWISHRNPLSSRGVADEVTGIMFRPEHEIWTHIEDGDTVGVFACAQYPGWRCVGVDASLTTWQFTDTRLSPRHEADETGGKH